MISHQRVPCQGVIMRDASVIVCFFEYGHTGQHSFDFPMPNAVSTNPPLPRVSSLLGLIPAPNCICGGCQRVCPCGHLAHTHRYPCLLNLRTGCPAPGCVCTKNPIEALAAWYRLPEAKARERGRFWLLSRLARAIRAALTALAERVMHRG